MVGVVLLSICTCHGETHSFASCGTVCKTIGHCPIACPSVLAPKYTRKSGTFGKCPGSLLGCLKIGRVVST